MNDDERLAHEHQQNHLVLTTSQNSIHERLDGIDETIDAMDRILRGDFEKDSTGLLARLHDLEYSVAKLNAVVFQSAEGQKGLVAKVEAIISGKMDAVERRKSRASVIIAIITSAALVITNLDRIGEFWIKLFVKEPKVVHIKKVRVRRVIDYSQPSSSE